MTQSTAAPPAAPAQPSGKLLAAIIVGGVTAILDTTIVAIGLQTLTHQLHASVATIQWVSTGYLLALAVAIPFVSWAQARFGGKRVWLFALSLFVLGSILCACAWDAPSLIAFRVVQGLGGGIMFPLMQTLAMQNVAPENRTRTMATVGIPAALGPILGPVLGGLVLEWLDWRWLFLINVPLGIVGLVLAMKFIADDRPLPGCPRPRVDAVGIVLLAPALAGLLYGLSNAHAEGGFGRMDVLVPAITGALLLVGFTVWAVRRAGTALVDVRLLAVRSSAIALTFLGAALFAGTFLLPLYFQISRGDGVLDAALLLIPQGVGSLLARLLASPIVERFGARAVAAAGFVLSAIATVPFALAGAETSLWLLGAALFVRGLCLGVVMIPVMTTAYIDIDRQEMPHASAITRIVQQLGGAFGTALVAVVLTAAATASDPATGFGPAFWTVIAMSAAAAAAALPLPGRKRS